MNGWRLPNTIISGRVTTSVGPEQLEKICMLACGPRENTNPYNQAGIDYTPFQINSPSGRSLIEREISSYFNALEAQRRASLSSLSVVSDNSGNMHVSVAYTDLETSARGEFTVTIPAGVV